MRRWLTISRWAARKGRAAYRGARISGSARTGAFWATVAWAVLFYGYTQDEQRTASLLQCAFLALALAPVGWMFGRYSILAAFNWKLSARVSDVELLGQAERRRIGALHLRKGPCVVAVETETRNRNRHRVLIRLLRYDGATWHRVRMGELSDEQRASLNSKAQDIRPVRRDVTLFDAHRNVNVERATEILAAYRLVAEQLNEQLHGTLD